MKNLATKIGMYLLAAGIINISSQLQAQNVGISSNGVAPDNSAMLDVDVSALPSNNKKGMLIPRVALNSTTDVSTIPSPANSLVVYNTNASMTGGNGAGFYYWNGSQWVYITGPSNGPGSAGQVLTSQGPGNAPVWQSGWRLIYVDDFDDGTVQGWTGPGAAPSTCGMWKLLGGYNNCGSGCNLTKTYNLTGIPHTKVMIKVYWVKVDSWDQGVSGTDFWVLQIDNTPVGGGAASANGGSQGSSSICGVNSSENNWTDWGPFVTVGAIAHTSNSVQVNIVANFDQPAWDESLGVDAVEVWVY